jgi:hypothetical protein
LSNEAICHIKIRSPNVTPPFFKRPFAKRFLRTYPQ